ncbi:hypothetical protein DFH06DRAFT_1132602 [Mycena polygramma]|nr:hypothetical protein DFH06DRAFT_1132602 [Mycena polygramma]
MKIKKAWSRKGSDNNNERARETSKILRRKRGVGAGVRKDNQEEVRSTAPVGGDKGQKTKEAIGRTKRGQYLDEAEEGRRTRCESASVMRPDKTSALEGGGGSARGLRTEKTSNAKQAGGRCGDIPAVLAGPDAGGDDADDQSLAGVEHDEDDMDAGVGKGRGNANDAGEDDSDMDVCGKRQA